ncbi:hypothetical protein BH10BAC5_BH10BAC5_05570 [soil metagenome]
MKKLIFIILLAATSLSAQWQPTTGLENKWIYSFAKSGNTLFAGEGLSILIHGSLNKSTNEGQSWTPIDLGMDPSAIMSMATKDNFVYAGTYQEHLFLSSDAGDTWQHVLVNSGFGTGIFEIGISGNNIMLYVNTIAAYYLSTNNGYNWNPVVSPNLSGNIFGFLNKDDLFFAATKKGIAYSTDHGFTWLKPANTGLPMNPDGSFPLSSIVQHGSRIYTSCLNKILYTTNNGDSWTETNIELGSFPNVNTMISYGGKVFASVSGQIDSIRGVKVTSNNGQNWNLMNNGLPASTGVYYMFLDNNYLLAGMSGKGIYRLPLSVISGVNGSSSSAVNYELMQNYPNPFNPVTKINYLTNNTGKVLLKIYDEAGKEVSTIVNEVQSPGSYSYIFDGSNLASGIYYYKLQAESFSDVKKMVLVR